MKSISLFMNITVDGFFEGENHDISFFKGDDEDDSFFKEQAKGGAAILLGHRTFNLMKSFWPTQQAQKMHPEVADYMNKMPKLAVSHKPFEPEWNNVKVISGNVTDEIKKLKEEPGKNIVILGSNMLSVSLMKEGLIDEFQFMLNPVVIGKGTRLFDGLNKKANLQLTGTRKFESGNVLMTYKKVD